MLEEQARQAQGDGDLMGTQIYGSQTVHAGDKFNTECGAERSGHRINSSLKPTTKEVTCKRCIKIVNK